MEQNFDRVQCPNCDAPLEPIENAEPADTNQDGNQICECCRHEFHLNADNLIDDDDDLDRSSCFHMNDDGELTIEEDAVRCPKCHRLSDLSEAGELAVVPCWFCRARVHLFWSEPRGRIVPEIRGMNPDWPQVVVWDDWYFDEETEAEDSDCPRGCQDPIFGGPVDYVLDNGQAQCAVCGMKLD